MNETILAVPLMSVPAVVHAHAAEVPLIIHAIEHGWSVLLVLPLLFFLLPLGCGRRG